MREVADRSVPRKPGGEGESSAVRVAVLRGLQALGCRRGWPRCVVGREPVCVSCWARSVLRAPMWTARRVGR